MKNLAQVKMESAEEKRRRIMALCLKQCESPDDRILLKIGSNLGDFANNLRSALNYTMHHFVETQLRPVLSSSEYRAIKGKQDFPWADSKAGYDNKGLVVHIKDHHADVYDFLESVQPYHEGNEWLRWLMRISNRDKHEIINEIRSPTMAAVGAMNPEGTPHQGPGFFGPGLDRILVKSEPEPHVHMCPCYYHPYGGFAIKGGQWAFFLISIDGQQLSLTRFLEFVPQRIGGLISDFNALI